MQRAVGGASGARGGARGGARQRSDGAEAVRESLPDWLASQAGARQQRRAGLLCLLELAAELAEVSARAREGQLKPQDIQGGCISVSSLGGIGGTAFTPIINAPEVAILGVSRSRMQPVWNGSEFEPRLMLPVSLSYDHRVIDGAYAVRFTTHLCQTLADVDALLEATP